MEAVIPTIQFDHVLTDPPYLYLNRAFDTPFDEDIFFQHVYRILRDTGFIGFFGRGTAFYRWNTHLAALGFKFLEELVWDKHRVSNICGNLLRKHETLSIHTKHRGKIRRAKVPYAEMRVTNLENLIHDIQRIKSAVGNVKELKDLLDYLETGNIIYRRKTTRRHGITVGNIGDTSIGVRIMKTIREGCVERSILEVPTVHYGSVHPTEKPVRLAERIIALISDVGDTIYDPFMGSGSFGIACINTKRKYIGSEINHAYFRIALKRIGQHLSLLEASNG
jgi:site-specific DNA-methyltransferase (adenine-specific)